MTDGRKLEICDAILRAYDRNVWPDVKLRLVEDHGTLVVRGLPFNDAVCFSGGYDEFCFNARRRKAAGSVEIGISFLEWSGYAADHPTDADLRDFAEAYSSVRAVIRDAGSWEELELRLIVAGLLDAG